MCAQPYCQGQQHYFLTGARSEGLSAARNATRNARLLKKIAIRCERGSKKEREYEEGETENVISNTPLERPRS